MTKYTSYKVSDHELHIGIFEQAKKGFAPPNLIPLKSFTQNGTRKQTAKSHQTQYTIIILMHIATI